MSDDTEHNDHNAKPYEFHNFNDDLRYNINIANQYKHIYTNPYNHNGHGAAQQFDDYCPACHYDFQRARTKYDIDQYAAQLDNTSAINHNDHSACHDNGASCFQDLHVVVSDNIGPTNAYFIDHTVRSEHSAEYLYNPYTGHKLDRTGTNRPTDGRSAGNWIRIFVDRLGFIRNFSKNH